MLCPLKAVSNYSWELGKLIGCNLRNVKGFLRNFRPWLKIWFYNNSLQALDEIVKLRTWVRSISQLLLTCVEFINLREDKEIVAGCIWVQVVHHNHHWTQVYIYLKSFLTRAWHCWSSNLLCLWCVQEFCSADKTSALPRQIIRIIHEFISFHFDAF